MIAFFLVPPPSLAGRPNERLKMVIYCREFFMANYIQLVLQTTENILCRHYPRRVTWHPRCSHALRVGQNPGRGRPCQQMENKAGRNSNRGARGDVENGAYSGSFILMKPVDGHYTHGRENSVGSMKMEEATSRNIPLLFHLFPL